MPPVITLTTDFGSSDSYVGVMKGVLLGICPTAHLVDITHTIAPQHVQEAAFVLPTFVPYFPAGSIHLVVVDPGVGSRARRPVAIATPQGLFVGPDNGVFGPIWHAALARWTDAEVHAVELSEARFWRAEVSTTFHGRDIFAPVAAHLATGVPLGALGIRVDTIQGSPLPEPEQDTTGSLSGQVVYIDHFGNCITNITAGHLHHQDGQVIVGTQQVGLIRHTYADVDLGMPLALVGSSGYLEIAIRNGNASEALQVTAGTAVQVLRDTVSPEPD